MLKEGLGTRHAACVTLVEHLGGGGFGEVWRCHVARGCTDRGAEAYDVAVKFFADAEAARYERAVSQTLRALSGEGEQGLFSLPLAPFGDEGVLVFPLARTDARLWLLEEQTHSLVDKMKVFDQVLLGLARMHKHGLAHADVKLDNVLIWADGRASLADFGVVCKYARGHDLQGIALCDSEAYTVMYRAVELLQMEERLAKNDAERKLILKAVDAFYNQSIMSARSSCQELRKNEPEVAARMTQDIRHVVAEKEDEWRRVRKRMEADIAADEKAKAREYRLLIGPATDAFAAGIMLYVLLFHRYPLGYITREQGFRPTPEAMQFRIEEDLNFRMYLSDDGFDDILRGLLHHDPRRRWTVQQAHTRLQKFLEM